MGVVLYMDVHVPHAITEQLRLRSFSGSPFAVILGDYWGGSS
jgi:hypothetical protein